MTVNAKALPGNYSDNQANDAAANATVQYVASGNRTLHCVYLDNTDNGAATYLKFWDATSGVTVGTTVPEFIFYFPAGVARQYTCPEGFPFSAGIAYAAVTTGGTAGNTAPSTAVEVKLTYD